MWVMKQGFMHARLPLCQLSYNPQLSFSMGVYGDTHSRHSNQYHLTSAGVGSPPKGQGIHLSHTTLHVVNAETGNSKGGWHLEEKPSCHGSEMNFLTKDYSPIWQWLTSGCIWTQVYGTNGQRTKWIWGLQENHRVHMWAVIKSEL